MIPVRVSKAAKDARPWATVIVVGPPVNDTLNCSPVEALVGEEDGGVIFRIPWGPEDGDLDAIAAGEPIWLTLWCQQMPPVALRVGVS